MASFHGNGIEICHEQSGSPSDPPVILIHGIGCQLVQWPASFVDGLVGRGLHVVRCDNRDAGLSTHLDELGPADIGALFTALLSGGTAEAPYGLADMADDVVALLDHLGLDDAHVVGVSMGGMIAQHLAITHGARVRSLTSIMSSTGNPELPPASPEAAATLVTPPPGNDRDSLVAHARAMWDVIGGPHHRSTEMGIGRLAESWIDRALAPAGFTRQFAAIVSDGARNERLGAVTTPTLVVHGAADPLVPLAAGEDTARAIPGARLEVLETMGHDLPEPLVPELVATIGEFVAGVDAARAETAA